MKQRFWLIKTLLTVSTVLIFVFSTIDIATAGSKVFKFSNSGLNWTVTENGRVIRSGHGVGGKSYCPDIKRGCRTPVGSFRIYSKAGPHFKSSIYPRPRGGAPMPWAMFFRGHYAIHGSNDVPNRPASHGCIRVYPSDARWLSHNLPIGTKVIVTG